MVAPGSERLAKPVAVDVGYLADLPFNERNPYDDTFVEWARLQDPPLNLDIRDLKARGLEAEAPWLLSTVSSYIDSRRRGSEDFAVRSLERVFARHFLILNQHQPVPKPVSRAAHPTASRSSLALVGVYGMDQPHADEGSDIAYRQVNRLGFGLAAYRPLSSHEDGSDFLTGALLSFAFLKGGIWDEADEEQAVKLATFNALEITVMLQAAYEAALNPGYLDGMVFLGVGGTVNLHQSPNFTLKGRHLKKICGQPRLHVSPGAKIDPDEIIEERRIPPEAVPRVTLGPDAQEAANCQLEQMMSTQWGVTLQGGAGFNLLDFLRLKGVFQMIWLSEDEHYPELLPDGWKPSMQLQVEYSFL